MKRIILLISSVFWIGALLSAQDQDPINVTFFGSSVCRGAGAENMQGYAWQFFHSGAIDTIKYKYSNASTGGDNTIRVEKEDRLTKKLYPTDPDIVVIGLSLGNEGIRNPQDNNGREQIVEQFRSRLLAMADSLNRVGIKPVIVNCYAHSFFNQAQYEYTKKINRLINTWSYPSINVLGTIDDMFGKWVEGYVADPWHPNTLGHEEMSYAIVPSLFDAIIMGKKTPRYDWNKSYSTLVNPEKIQNPLTIDVSSTIHSFTVSFRFKKTENGSIVGFRSGNGYHPIVIEGHRILYKDLSAIYPKHLNHWTHVVLSHSFANEKTSLYVNGQLAGRVDEQLVPSQVYFGGTASSAELKDLALHRSSLHEDEVLDLFNKKFIQSSLEFYNPLTKPTSGNIITNLAQSLTKMSIATGTKLEHQKVNF